MCKNAARHDRRKAVLSVSLMRIAGPQKADVIFEDILIEDRSLRRVRKQFNSQ